MYYIIFVTALLAIICVGIHFEAFNFITYIIEKAKINSKYRILIAMIGSLIAHILEFSLFGVAYFIVCQDKSNGYLVGDISSVPDLAEYMYYSAAVYTSLGFGDIVPVGYIRIMTSVEATAGLVLIAWTASYAFSQMQQVMKRRYKGKS